MTDRPRHFCTVPHIAKRFLRDKLTHYQLKLLLYLEYRAGFQVVQGCRIARPTLDEVRVVLGYSEEKFRSDNLTRPLDALKAAGYLLGYGMGDGHLVATLPVHGDNGKGNTQIWEFALHHRHWRLLLTLLDHQEQKGQHRIACVKKARLLQLRCIGGTREKRGDGDRWQTLNAALADLQAEGLITLAVPHQNRRPDGKGGMPDQWLIHTQKFPALARRFAKEQEQRALSLLRGTMSVESASLTGTMSVAEENASASSRAPYTENPQLSDVFENPVLSDGARLQGVEKLAGKSDDSSRPATPSLPAFKTEQQVREDEAHVSALISNPTVKRVIAEVEARNPYYLYPSQGSSPQRIVERLTSTVQDFLRSFEESLVVEVLLSYLQTADHGKSFAWGFFVSDKELPKFKADCLQQLNSIWADREDQELRQERLPGLLRDSSNPDRAFRISALSKGFSEPVAASLLWIVENDGDDLLVMQASQKLTEQEKWRTPTLAAVECRLASESSPLVCEVLQLEHKRLTTLLYPPPALPSKPEKRGPETVDDLLAELFA